MNSKLFGCVCIGLFTLSGYILSMPDPNGLARSARTIAPGFPSTSIDQAGFALNLGNLFKSVNPFTLRWNDRRPIGSLILATAASHWPKNPRGWFLDPNLEITSAAGLAKFRIRLLAWADRSVAILQRMNAQGMVTWDVEGEQFPHPITYVGDPRLVEQLAPEMQSVIDEYFARFRRAGLRVGVTIRPQTICVSADGKVAHQTKSSDPAQVLVDKITYARRRWGATLFYVDSNGDEALPLSFAVLARVAQVYPDVLLMPEHKNAIYYAKTAPYTELRRGYSSTPEIVRSIYPGAFSVVNTADAPVSQYFGQLKRSVANGDILMFHAWFDDPANALIKELASSRERSY